MVYVKYALCESADDNCRRDTAHRARAELLNIAFDITNTDELIKIANGGKPYIENAPFDFSDAHTENAVAVAAAGEGGYIEGLICIDETCKKIGIDIEYSGRAVKKEKMAIVIRKLFSRKESEYVCLGTPGDKERFLEIWTKKESIIKATGEGLKAIRGADTFKFSGAFLKTEYVKLGEKDYIVSLAGI